MNILTQGLVKGKILSSVLRAITTELCGIGISALGGKILPNQWLGTNRTLYPFVKRRLSFKSLLNGFNRNPVPLTERVMSRSVFRSTILALAVLLLSGGSLFADGKDTPSVSTTTTNVLMTPEHVWWLSILATVGLIVMWGIFWATVCMRKESVKAILVDPAFFKTVTVMGIVAATVVLSLAGRLEGNITGAILSGIVGYVLGSITGKSKVSGRGDGGNNPPVEPSVAA